MKNRYILTSWFHGLVVSEQSLRLNLSDYTGVCVSYSRVPKHMLIEKAGWFSETLVRYRTRSPFMSGGVLT